MPQRLRTIPPFLWLTAGPLIVVGLGMAAFAEELLFRGWLLQVGRRGFRSTWPTAALSVAMFTLAHLGYGTDAASFAFVFAVSDDRGRAHAGRP